MDTIITILINAAAFFIGAQLLSGVKINSFIEALIAAVVISILNVTIGLFLKILTLGLLSWGIFSLLLDAILIQIADYFLDGISVKSFWWALLLASFVALACSFMTWILGV